MFIDFIKNNTLSLFSILIIIVFIVISILLIIEMRKLKKQLNDNGINRNNISEILNVQRTILSKIEVVKKENTEENKRVNENINQDVGNLDIKKGKYTENEIGDMLIDIIMELKKTSKSLNNWRGFGIFIIITIIALIIKYCLGLIK